MRVLAVEDGRFKTDLPKNRRGETQLIFVITLGFKIQKIVFRPVQVDGFNATSTLIQFVENERRKPDLILLSSISYAGFNLIDIVQVYEQLKIPIIVANKEQPKEGAVESALLNNFPDWEQRLNIVEKAGKPDTFIVSGEKIYGHALGVKKEEANKILEKLTVLGKLPETLRIARILAHELIVEEKKIV
jgi:uncharacterized protein